MNTERVVEMIDAITEGRDYVLRPKVIEGWQGLAIGISDDEILFSTEDDPTGTKVNDPRAAREIAAALVAWANRRDGLLAERTAGSLLGDIRRSEVLNERSDGV